MNRHALFLVFCCLCAGCFTGRCLADIYSFIDESGVVHFSNVPAHTGYRRVRYRRGRTCDPHRYDAAITRLGEKYGVTFELIKAMVKAESGFNPVAVSSKGALGLMQIMPEKARELRVRDPFDPHQNLEGGVRYFRSLLDKFENNERLALAAYNAGENAVRKENGVPLFEETREYIRKVLLFKKEFERKQQGPGTNAANAGMQ